MLLTPDTLTAAAVVVDSAPLMVVAEMIQAGHYRVVLVVNEDQRVLGLARSDSVLRLAHRLPAATARMLPLQRVLEVSDSLTLAEARQLLTVPDIEGLLIEKSQAQGWAVLLRDTVLNDEAPQQQRSPN